jgi:hypothetical protein
MSRLVERVREAAPFACVHAALLVASWLFAVQVYALAFATSVDALWIAIDALVIAAALAFVYRFRQHIGLGSLGDRKAIKLVALVVVATVCVIATHVLIADGNGVWLDESNYLATLRAGRILGDGIAPFNMRWLEPFLAGPLNVLPVRDMDALKAINFGAFVVTAVYLALLLVRLRVRYVHALAAPVFLLCSYLGVYGASNRLLVDPFNYAMFVVLFHVLLRREHWKYFPIALLVAALNSEKALYWLPVFAVTAVIQLDRPWTKRHLLDAGLLVLRYGAPTIIYMIAIGFYLRGSHTEPSPMFTENLHRIAFTSLGADIANETARLNNFQILWFPFGAFTVYALLGLTWAPRRLRAFVLLLIPIFLQALIAHDTERMVAYAFIVYLPFGYIYLATAFRDLPKLRGAIVFALLVLLAFAQYFLFPLADHLDWRLAHVNRMKLYLAAAEIILATGLVSLHLIFYDSPRRAERAP